MSKGSTWKKWDFHLHTPYSALNNQYGNPEDEETWKKFITEIEKIAEEKKIAAIGITDYFTIDGYKKLIKYQEKGRLSGIFLFPNVEFRINKTITIIKDGKKPKSKSLNFHVIYSPDLEIEDIEEHFLHELDFAYENDPFNEEETSKLKKKRLEALGSKLKNEESSFSGLSEFKVGCMNAVVDPSQIKKILEKKSVFKGNYLLVLADENLSDLEWKGQDHNTRKNLLQMSHAVFSSNERTINFCLGKNHNSVDEFINEFKSLKPCIWGCDGHSFDERFLEPCKGNNGEINYCWIKSKVSWEGLKQILYEPEERVRIQENTPNLKKVFFLLIIYLCLKRL